MHFGKSKLAIAVLLVFGFSSLAAAQANWNFNPVNEPFSMNETGVNTTTVQVVDLTYDDPETGDPVALEPSDLEQGDRENITYYYNKSMGEATTLNHLYDEYWYAEFQPNFTSGNMIKYNASGTVVSEDTPVNSGEVVNITEDLGVGNLKVHVLSGVDDEVKADSRIKLDVAVENASSGEMVTDSDGSVQVSFSNGTGEVVSYNLDNFNDISDSDDYPNFDRYFFNSEVDLPAATNATYVMNVEATNSSGEKPHGTWSKVVKTLPSIHGKVTEFHSANGCNNKEMVSNCEAGANISIDYNITASQAQSVNLSLYAFNSSGRHELAEYSMDETSDAFFEREVELPDLNTSKYEEEIEFAFNATNNERMHIDRRNVTLEQFVINRAGSPTAYVGNTYDLKLFMGKPYSLAPYNKSRFSEMLVNVTDSDGELVENFTMSELNYDESEGVMETDLLIGSERPAGAYDLDVRAENIYNRESNLNSGFNVEDLDATFDIETDLEFDVDQLGAQTFDVDLSSTISDSNELNVTEDLPDEIDVINETAQLSSNEEDILEIEVNLSEMEDASGEFQLSDEDTGYNQTVEVEVNAADCTLTAGDLCTTTGDWINVTTDSTAETARNIQLLNLNPDDGNITFNTSISGGISGYLEIDGATEDIEISDSMQLQLLYNPAAAGNYTGKVILETENGDRMEIQTALEADLSEDQGSGGQGSGAELSVSSDSIDLGYIPQGDSATGTVEITNTGSQQLSDITAESDTYSVTASGVSQLQPGQASVLTLEFDDLQSESGEVTIASGEAEATISVSANPVQNYAQQTTQLRARLESLQGQVESSELETQLTEASTKISSISTEWDSGNYEEAQNMYEEVDATLQTVSAQTSSDQSDSEPDGESSGGFPILMVGGVIFLLLIAGFVVYTSYIPEKGDPLYDVLGE